MKRGFLPTTSLHNSHSPLSSFTKIRSLEEDSGIILSSPTNNSGSEENSILSTISNRHLNRDRIHQVYPSRLNPNQIKERRSICAILCHEISNLHYCYSSYNNYQFETIFVKFYAPNYIDMYPQSEIERGELHGTILLQFQSHKSFGTIQTQ